MAASGLVSRVLQTGLNLKILSCDIDWLTCTVAKPARLPFAQAAVKRWQTVRSADGYPIRAYAANSYVGEYVDGITWGERPDGAMCRLSGEMAAKYATQALLWAENVSRIDYQVTLVDNNSDRDWGDQFYRAFSGDERVKSGMTRWEEIHSSNGGSTMYLGRRSSSRFYRVYNKTAESDGAYPETSWRFEVEYKPPRSQRWAMKMCQCAWDNRSTLEALKASFGDYGFVIPCDGIPRGFKDMAPREKTTDERRLEYLRKYIRPMMSKLRESFDEGVILEAIGYFDSTTGEVTPSHLTAPPSLT